MKSLFEQNGGTYREENGYLIPDLTVEDSEWNISIYGRRHLQYIKQHRRALYSSLMISGKLKDYLQDIDNQAAELRETLIQQYKTQYGITEKLKAENQMEWVGLMNNINRQAEETILSEIVYADVT